MGKTVDTIILTNFTLRLIIRSVASDYNKVHLPSVLHFTLFYRLGNFKEGNFFFSAPKM